MSAPSAVPPPEDALYGYIPHEPVAIGFLILFGISTLAHVAQAVHYRMWWLFPTACACGAGELIGWAGRLWSSLAPTLTPPFRMQLVSLVIAPTPLIAVNFTLLTMIITTLGPRYARLRPGIYTPLFLSSDIIALLIQAGGGSIASSGTTLARVQLGAHVLLTGICFQLLALTIYACLGAEFFIRYIRDKPLKSLERARRGIFDSNTRTMFYALALCTLLLFIRSIYRVIDLASGWGGRIMHTERYFNVLDGGMIMLAMFTFNFAHPGRLIPRRKPRAASAGYEEGGVDLAQMDDSAPI